MKNYLRTNYPIWRRQERRSKYASMRRSLLHGSWDHILQRCPSVRHTFLTMFPSSYHHEIFRSYYQWQKWRPCKRSKFKVTEVNTQLIRFRTVTLVWWWNPMQKAWCCLGEVPSYFSRSSVKFQGHTAKKIIDFDPNWAFPDCNSSLNSPMATKWCTKLEVA